MGKKPKKNAFDLDRIDRLLAQFPDEEPDPAKPKAKTGEPALPPGKPKAAAGQRNGSRAERAASPITAWIRVLAGVVLAVAMTQWPYARSCGFGLALYLLAAAGVLATGAWAAAYTWKASLGVPHLMALGVSLWGLTLVGHQVLRRVGYAKAEATWTCLVQVEGPSPAAQPAQPVPEQAVAVTDSSVGDSASSMDSVAQADSAVLTDSIIPGDTIPPDTLPEGDSQPERARGLTGR